MEERQTACLFTNGSSVINYTYNADGVRIGKSGSRAGTFIVSGTQILREINSVATIDYLYDENGSPIGLPQKSPRGYNKYNRQHRSKGSNIHLQRMGQAYVNDRQYGACSK